MKRITVTELASKWEPAKDIKESNKEIKYPFLFGRELGAVDCA